MENNLEAFFASMYQTPSSNYRRSSITLTGDLHAALPDKSIKWDKIWNGDLNAKVSPAILVIGCSVYGAWQDVRYYLDTFKRGGMTGPLNYYRTTKLRFEEEKGEASWFIADSSFLNCAQHTRFRHTSHETYLGC